MKRRRKLALVVAGLAIVAAVYTGAWFYIAAVLRHRADAFITSLTGKGIRAACVNLDVSGYPVEIGLTCDRIDASKKRNGGRVEAGAFRSFAEFAHPGSVRSELTGPLRANASGGYTVRADWNRFQSSAELWFRGLMRAHLQVRKLTATVDGPRLPGPLDVTSPEMEVQTRQNGSDVDVAFAVHQLSVTGEHPFDSLPAADVSGTATLSGMAHLLSGRQGLPDPVHVLRGRSGTLNKLTAKLADGASFIVQGPFSFDELGPDFRQLQASDRGPPRVAADAGQGVPARA